jgi:hypothetical protein
MLTRTQETQDSVPRWLPPPPSGHRNDDDADVSGAHSDDPIVQLALEVVDALGFDPGTATAVPVVTAMGLYRVP